MALDGIWYGSGGATLKRQHKNLEGKINPMSVYLEFD